MQPASLDLRLGERAWRVRASFLPGLGRKVADRLPDVAMHRLDLTGGAVLERGCVYIAEIAGAAAAAGRASRARANPKSSTGRVDVFVRACSPTMARPSTTSPPATRAALPGDRAADLLGAGAHRHAAQPAAAEASASRRLLATQDVGVDLTGGLAGFRARRHAGVIDLDLEDGHDPRDFWEPLEPRRGELLLDPGEFYILASKQAVEIPVLQAAEMTPIDPAVGEFRVHYAGFFDPGFGAAETGSAGSRGVLEVRSHETPVPAGGRPDRGAAGLRAADRTPDAALWRRRLALPAPGAEAVEAFQGLVRRAM